jgi:phospholipase C
LEFRAFAAPVAAALIVAIPACSSVGGSGSRNQTLPPAMLHATSLARTPAVVVRPGNYIKHVVIIVQENRSFDNVFAGYPGADAPMHGYKIDAAGKRSRIVLHQVTFGGNDVPHGWKTAMSGWDNGKMDGFNKELFVNGQPGGDYPYGYLERKLVAPYWTLAQRYTLADRMFPTEFGGSFTAHLALISTTTNVQPGIAEVDNPNAQPWGCNAPAQTITLLLDTHRRINRHGPFPCFTQFQTMAETLDHAKVSWKYYAPSVASYDPGGLFHSEFESIRYVRQGSDWQRNIISPQTTVLNDAKAGNLAAVSWVIPDFLDSDHAGSNSDTGPSWVASVVNAIGEGPDWDSTAVVILWDEWGGWYDNVPPPQLDFRGLGMRVPCIIVSPYAKPNHVSHTQYEYGSVLKFVEQVFDLPSLGNAGTFGSGYTDERATSIENSFDFAAPPRSYVPVKAPYSPSYFTTRRPSGLPPDDDG